MESNKEKLEAYLESIGGLENGYFTDQPPIKSTEYFECGTGWYPLIQKLIEDLIKLGWNKQICQAKEKFGGLRFYTNDLPDGGRLLVNFAEGDSYQICEECGEAGLIRLALPWKRTLCDTHYHQIKNERSRIMDALTNSKNILNTFENRWIDRMRTRIESDLDASIRRLLDWYDSDTYISREYRLGHSPREPLLWILLGYARKYGTICTDAKYANLSTSEMYYVGSFVIQVMHEHKSIIKIYQIIE
jgi:hypothetical protein